MSQFKNYSECSFSYYDLVKLGSEMGRAASFLRAFEPIDLQWLTSLYQDLQKGDLSGDQRKNYKEKLYHTFRNIYISGQCAMEHDRNLDLSLLPEFPDDQDKINQLLAQYETTNNNSATSIISKLIDHLKQENCRDLCLESLSQFSKATLDLSGVDFLRNGLENCNVIVDGERKTFTSFFNNQQPKDLKEIIKVFADQLELKSDHIGFLLTCWNQRCLTSFSASYYPLFYSDIYPDFGNTSLKLRDFNAEINIVDKQLRSITINTLLAEHTPDDEERVAFNAKLVITLPPSQDQTKISLDNLQALMPCGVSPIKPDEINLTFTSKLQEGYIKLPEKLKVVNSKNKEKLHDKVKAEEQRHPWLAKLKTFYNQIKDYALSCVAKVTGFLSSIFYGNMSQADYVQKKIPQIIEEKLIDDPAKLEVATDQKRKLSVDIPNNDPSNSPVMRRNNAGLSSRGR